MSLRELVQDGIQWIDKGYRRQLSRRAKDIIHLFGNQNDEYEELEFVRETRERYKNYSFFRSIVEPGYLFMHLPFTYKELGFKKSVVIYALIGSIETMKLGCYYHILNDIMKMFQR